MHGSHRLFHVRLLVCLVFLLAAGRLKGDDTDTVSFTLGTTVWASGSVTWTVGESSTVFAVSCTGHSGSYTSLKLYANGTIYGGSGINAGQTGTYTVTNPTTLEGAQFRIFVWDNNTVGDDIWIDWEIEADVQVVVSLRNTSDFPVEYQIWQDGEVKGSLTLQPGTAVIQDITSLIDTDGGEVTVLALVDGLTQDGSSWVVVEGAVTTIGPLATITPSNDGSSGTADSPVTVTGPTGLPSVSETSTTSNTTTTTTVTSSPTVWTSEGDGDALTNDVYREGVDKQVVWAQEEVTAQDETTAAVEDVKDEVAGVRDDLAEISDQLSAIADKLDAETEEEEEEDEQEAYDEAAATYATAEESGRAAATAEKGMIPQPDARSYVVSTSEPEFTIAMMGRSVDWNPFRSDRAGPIADWLRTAEMWLCVVLFGWYCLGASRDLVLQMQTTRQAHGNTFAGSGAQITAFAMAVAITAAVAVCLVAIMVFATSDFGVGTLLEWLAVDPLDGLPAQVAYLIDRVIPVGAVVAYFVGRLIWAFGAQAAVVFCAAIIRFCVM